MVQNSAKVLKRWYIRLLTDNLRVAPCKKEKGRALCRGVFPSLQGIEGRQRNEIGPIQGTGWRS